MVTKSVSVNYNPSQSLNFDLPSPKPPTPVNQPTPQLLEIATYLSDAVQEANGILKTINEKLFGNYQDSPCNAVTPAKCLQEILVDSTEEMRRHVRSLNTICSKL
jgi:hypothetical protein